MKKKTFIVQLLDSKNPNKNSFTQVEDANFYSNDTDASLVFIPHEDTFEFQTAKVVMHNRGDESLVERDAVVTTENGRKVASYELPAEIISHWGEWTAQPVFISGGEIYSGSIVPFSVFRYLMHERPPRLNEVVTITKFIQQSQALVDDMAQKETQRVTQEQARQSAEAVRVQAESERSEKYGSYAQQFNDVITELSEEKDYHSLPEIAGARGGFDTLGERLDNTMRQKADKEEVRMKSVKLELEDMSENTLGAMSGQSTFNLLSVPQNESVTFEKMSPQLRSKLVKNLVNLINNGGDFTSGAEGWNPIHGTFSVSNGEGVFLATSNLARVSTPLNYDDADVIYRSVWVKSTSAFVSLGASGHRWAHHSGSGNYERLSDQRVWADNKHFAVVDGRSSDFDNIYIKHAIAINLTKVFGAGNEPQKHDVDVLLSEFENYWFSGNVILNNSDTLIKEANDNVNKVKTELDGHVIKRLDSHEQANLITIGGDFTNAPVSTNADDTDKWRVSRGTTLVSNNNGIVTFRASSELGRLYSHYLTLSQGRQYYFFSKFKSDSPQVGLMARLGAVSMNISPNDGFHSGDGEFELVSTILSVPIPHTEWMLAVADHRTSGYDNIEVDFIGCIDLTEEFGNNIPSKDDLDNLIKNGEFSETGIILSTGKNLSDRINNLEQPSFSNFYYPTMEINDFSNHDDFLVSDLYTLWDGLISNYPSLITKTVLGKDQSGIYDIWKLDIKPFAPKYKIVIIANQHGNGPNGDPKDGGMAIYNFIKDILDNSDKNHILEWLRYNVHFVLIPCVNPWGYEHDTRENSRGVDLNRNYDYNWVEGTYGSGTYGGTTPFSELETQYVRDVLEENGDAVGFIDAHAYGVSQKTYTYPAAPVSLDGLSGSVVYEVTEYLGDKYNVEREVFTNPDIPPTPGLAKNYAKYIKDIESTTLEFVVYADGYGTHSAVMMTRIVEWYGNIFYIWLQNVANPNVLNGYTGDLVIGSGNIDDKKWNHNQCD